MRKAEVTEYTITTNKFPKDFAGFRFAVMSDMHSNLNKLDLSNLKDIIAEKKPDAILIAGDMINKIPREDISQVSGFIVELAGIYPVFYALGNHEYRMKLEPYVYGDKFEIYSEYLSEAGVCFLQDETVYLEKDDVQIALSGIEIDSVFYRKKCPVMGDGLIAHHLGTVDSSVYNILIAHHPEYFDNYAKWGADLVLSGHVHGGIIRLPNGQGLVSTTLKFLPKYDSGMYTMGEESVMLLTRGLGTHSHMVRINNKPELVIANILAKKS